MLTAFNIKNHLLLNYNFILLDYLVYYTQKYRHFVNLY